MKITSKYITKEFLKIFFICIISFIAIYLIVDFFERIDLFIKHNVASKLMFSYFIYKIPYIIYQISPVAVLMATLLTLVLLSRNFEIIAMKAIGVGFLSIISPLISIGTIVSISSFILENNIAPYFNQKVEYIENVEVKKRSDITYLRKNKIWYHSGNSIYNFDFFLPQQNILRGITIIELDKNNRIKKRTDAKIAIWDGGKWNFKNIAIRSFEDKQIKTVDIKDEMVIELPQTIEDFKVVEREPKEMSFSEIKLLRDKIKNEGYDATNYSVELNAKLSTPIINLIMVILGIPFAFNLSRRGGVALSIVVSIVISFIFWIALAFGLSLGHSGVLPPVISAWSADVIFLLIGMYLLYRTYKH